jgi:hypothetical protein
MDFFLFILILPAALWSTQLLTEMSTRNLSGGKGRPACKAENVTAVWADCLENMGTLTSYNPMGLHGLLQGYLYPFYIEIYAALALSPWNKCNCSGRCLKYECEQILLPFSFVWRIRLDFPYCKDTLSAPSPSLECQYEVAEETECTVWYGKKCMCLLILYTFSHDYTYIDRICHSKSKVKVSKGIPVTGRGGP